MADAPRRRSLDPRATPAKFSTPASGAVTDSDSDSTIDCCLQCICPHSSGASLPSSLALQGAKRVDLGGERLVAHELLERLGVEPKLTHGLRGIQIEPRPIPNRQRYLAPACVRVDERVGVGVALLCQFEIALDVPEERENAVALRDARTALMGIFEGEGGRQRVDVLRSFFEEQVVSLIAALELRVVGIAVKIDVRVEVAALGRLIGAARPTCLPVRS